MSDPAPASGPSGGVFSRAAGMVLSPAATFADVIRVPRPAGILFLVCLVIGLAAALPQFTERGQQQLLTLQRQQMERMGLAVTPEMAEAMARRAPYAGYQTFAAMFVVLPVFSMLVGGFCWAVFNVVLGGTATFKQVLAIVAHSQVIRGLGAVVSAPIIWVQGLGSVAGPFNLGALAPTVDPSSLLAATLGGLDFFSLWQAVVVAIGLGVLYHRRSTGIAIALIAVYVGLVAAFAAAFTTVLNR